MIELIHGIKHVLEREIPSLKGVERTDRCAYLRNRLARAKQVHRTILVEIRELPKDQTGDWDAKAKQYETEIGQLLQDVEWAETTAKSNDPGGVKKPTIDEMTTKEVTKQAMMVQNETKGATERILRNIDQTTALAVDVNTELVRQGEQLHNVKEGLDSVESNLKRADKQLRVFMRRMSTDKIFLLFIFLITIGLVVAIVLYILKKQGVVNIGS
ncbi:hypothetical protein HK100_011823 [Physocladia obscura]|uniref:t-SNARE coiled-coil homology domain-containing protein n=1 Tax=Physocladia obscura TaxID=109957 RepID=A0AAD5T8P1_9FUNG|nr:hypothetical protein HK100_011823 [Physocladia obscura]